MKHFRKAFTKPLFFLTALVVILMAAFWLVRERHRYQPSESYRNSLSHGVQQAKLHGIDDSDRDVSVADSADVKRPVGHNDHPVAGDSPDSELATHTESGASNSNGMDEDILGKLAQELGSWSMEIDAMNEVFVFVDGRYVGPPYAMKRTGYTVTLNGTTLYSSPPVKDGYESTLPVVPQNLDAISSRRDIWGRRQNGRTWLHRFINWHFSQLGPSDGADAALAAMRKLPFVKSIQIENDYVSTDDFGDRVPIKIGWTLNTQRDEVMKFDFRHGYPDLRPYSKEAFQSLLETQLFNPIEKATRDGGIVMIATHPSSVAFHACRNAEGIAIVLDVMRSSKSNEYKYQILTDALQLDSFRAVDATSHLRNFISGFRPHVEFESRVNELCRKKSLKRWKDSGQ